MSAMRSASSMAVTSTADRSHVRWVVWSVSLPGVATRTSTPRCSSATCRLNDMPPTTKVVVRPIALANGVIASTTCWASSRVGTSTRPRGLRLWERPSAMRASTASPKARVLPEPVWPRPRRSRPASASGRVAAWIGNGSVKPSRSSARRTGSGMPSSAKDGMPDSGAVQITSGGAAATSAGRDSWPRAMPGRLPLGRRRRPIGVCARRDEEGDDKKEPPGRGTSHGKAAPRWRQLRFQRRARARTSRPGGMEQVRPLPNPCRSGALDRV